MCAWETEEEEEEEKQRERQRIGSVLKNGEGGRREFSTYFQHHPTQLRGEKQLLPFPNQGVDDKVFAHIWVGTSARSCPLFFFLGRKGVDKTQNAPLLPVCMQSTPSRAFLSLTCRDLIAASVSMGLRPEFSARAIGMESSASAKARMAYCSRPGLCDRTDRSQRLILFTLRKLSRLVQWTADFDCGLLDG